MDSLLLGTFRNSKVNFGQYSRAFKAKNNGHQNTNSETHDFLSSTKINSIKMPQNDGLFTHNNGLKFEAQTINENSRNENRLHLHILNTDIVNI